MKLISLIPSIVVYALLGSLSAIAIVLLAALIKCGMSG